MKKTVFWYAAAAVSLVYLYVGFLGDVRAVDPVPRPVSFDLSRVKVSEVVQLMYRDVLQSPYLIEPEVLNDQREISLRFQSQKNLQGEVAELLDSLGLSVQKRNGVSIVAMKKAVEPAGDMFVYRPRYRDVSHLVELLRPLFKGQFTHTRSISAPQSVARENTKPVQAGSAASLVDRDSDVLVFHGPAAEVRQLEKLLAQVDIRQGEVMVRGVVYEVGASTKDSSAFSLALDILGGKLSLVAGATNALDNVLRFKNHSIDAVVSALSTDSLFKVVSSPSLRVRSGGNGRFSVGQDVPVLGAVVYSQSGQSPIQSVEYRSSGVIFDLQPVVRDAVVDLDVTQQISSSVATETGVNGSPTLIKREVRTALSLSDGDVVLLGGLAENKESAGRNGLSFLPDFMRSKSGETARSEILLVLQLTRVQ